MRLTERLSVRGVSSSDAVVLVPLRSSPSTQERVCLLVEAGVIILRCLVGVYLHCPCRPWPCPSAASAVRSQQGNALQQLRLFSIWRSSIVAAICRSRLISEGLWRAREAALGCDIWCQGRMMPPCPWQPNHINSTVVQQRTLIH
jgi:hypothetical protein